MITLNEASKIVDFALSHGRQQNCHPLSVSVLDAGGVLVAFKREDDSSLLRPDISQAKAWGALGMGVNSRDLTERANSHPHFFTALSSISGGRIVPVAGGVLIRSNTNKIIGAVGISGDLPHNDEECAIKGIEAAGLACNIS
ncbi:MAG: heme-binding protein [Emcibacter sp.]|nr:heme-binding protein [Emcibacter sp.]